MDAAHPAMYSRAILRAVLYANFSLLVLFVIPITHHWVDQAFFALRSRSIRLEDFVGQSMQVWIVVSTIIATALFGLMLWSSRRAALPVRSIRFEGILLFTWWIALLGACAYGFMLGMGG
jgi:hypothetical protein